MARTSPPSSRRAGAIAFAVVSTGEGTRDALGRLCSKLSDLTGVVVYPQIARSYEALQSAVSSGSVDLAWTPPIIAGQLAREGLARLLVCSSRAGASIYHSVLFARRDSGIVKPEQLRDKHVGWVARTSSSGYVLPRAWLRANGYRADEIFSEETFHETHGGVAEAVLGKRVDVGATYAELDARSRVVVRAGWSDLAARTGDAVHVVANAGAVPADGVSVSVRVAQDVQEGLKTALLSLGADESVRDVFDTERFEACSASHESAVAALVDVCTE